MALGSSPTTFTTIYVGTDLNTIITNFTNGGSFILRLSVFDNEEIRYSELVRSQFPSLPSFEYPL